MEILESQELSFSIFLELKGKKFIDLFLQSHVFSQAIGVNGDLRVTNVLKIRFTTLQI